jgi:hypothetical protein
LAGADFLAQFARATQELAERNGGLWRLRRETGRVEPLAALGRVLSAGICTIVTRT